VSVIKGGLNHIGLCLNPANRCFAIIERFLEAEAIFGELVQCNAEDPPQVIYPLYFMPDMDEAVIDNFLNRLELAIKS
jgi:hypothetical protein